MQFVGRMVGKAFVDNQPIRQRFLPSVYKRMLRLEVTEADLEEDLEAIDADSLAALRNTRRLALSDAAEDAELGFFTVTTQNAFKEMQEVELRPGGAGMAVTRDNVGELCRLRLRLETGADAPQTAALLRGFHAVVPAGEWLAGFAPAEAELLLHGEAEVDIADMRTNADYGDGYAADSPQVAWLWEVAAELGQEARGRLLHFITGRRRVPTGGFAELARDASGGGRVKIQRGLGGDVGKLPTAHTCVNSLVLPEYPSKEVLRAKLLQAIENATGFGFR